MTLRECWPQSGDRLTFFDDHSYRDFYGVTTKNKSGTVLMPIPAARGSFAESHLLDVACCGLLFGDRSIDRLLCDSLTTLRSCVTNRCKVPTSRKPRTNDSVSANDQRGLAWNISCDGSLLTTPSSLTLRRKNEMRKLPLILLAALIATASSSITTARPAVADDSMVISDCSQAESMLNTAVSAKASTILTGDVDKDFVTLMMLHESVGKRIDQIEAKCGKNAKMQAMASKGSDDAQMRLDMFRNTSTSQ